MFANAGVRSETRDTAGATRLLEQLAFIGSAKRPQAAFEDHLLGNTADLMPCSNTSLVSGGLACATLCAVKPELVRAKGDLSSTCRRLPHEVLDKVAGLDGQGEFPVGTSTTIYSTRSSRMRCS